MLKKSLSPTFATALVFAAVLVALQLCFVLTVSAQMAVRSRNILENTRTDARNLVEAEGIVFSNLSSIKNKFEFTTSVELNKSAAKTSPARVQLPVAFFSQRNSLWSVNQLGICTQVVKGRTVSLTIGDAGCAISAIAMAGSSKVKNFNPASLNAYLKNNKGYSSGCNVIWSNAANIDGAGGFQYVGSGTVGTTAKTLKSRIDGGQYMVVKSTRFVTKTNPNAPHYGVIIGYNNGGTKLSDFFYLDPWDQTATFRSVSDGWVGSNSVVQIYK